MAAEDAVISPTYLPDLVQAALDLLIDGERGLWHLANPSEITWADLARRTAELVDLDPGRVEGRQSWALGLAAPRSLYNALGSERASLLPPLENALERYLHQVAERALQNSLSRRQGAA